MYTCLKHEDILINVRKAVEEAKKFLTRINHEDTKYRKLPRKLKETEELMEFVRFVVENTFIIIDDGNTILHQVEGIPMGTNSAPEISTLTLYIPESKYMDELEKIDNEKAKAYANTYRFIDDGLTFGVEFPPQEKYGLHWSETTLPDGSVNYLGAHIEIVNGYLHISIFDKAAEWNFPVIKYPHADSNAPYHQSAGVFQGQLSRFRIVCSAIKFFKIATTELTRKMLFRKHKALALIKGWNKHLTRCSTDKFTNHSRLRQWFRRMLTWVLHHPFQYKAKQKEGINTKQVWKPKAAVQKEPEIEGASFQVASTNLGNTFMSGKQDNLINEPPTSFDHRNDEPPKPFEHSTDVTVQSQAEHSRSYENEVLVQPQGECSEVSTSELLLEFENHPGTLEFELDMKDLLSLQRKRKYDGGSFRVKCQNCLQAFKNEYAMGIHKRQGKSKCLVAVRVRQRLLLLKGEQSSNTQLKGKDSSATKQLSSGEENQDTQISHLLSNDSIPQQLDKSVFNKLSALLKGYTNGEAVLESSEAGISGVLVETVAEILDRMRSTASYISIGRWSLTTESLNILLSGIKFHPLHKSTAFFRSSKFMRGDSWITGEHIEMLIYLMYRMPPRNCVPKKDTKPFLVSSSYYTYHFHGKDQYDSEAVPVLRKLARENGLSNPDTNTLTGDTLFLFPVTIRNDHWLLAVVWCHALTFTIFNPFHPTNPTNKELHIAEDFALAVKEAFALEAFQQTQPEIAHTLPIQADGFNCGIFIIMYALKIILESSDSPQYHLEFNDPNVMRVLIASWLLSQEGPIINRSSHEEERDEGG